MVMLLRITSLLVVVALVVTLPRESHAVHADWEVSMRDEVRVRERLQQDIGLNAVAMDIECNPLIGIGVEGAGTRMEFQYAPRLLLRQPYRQAAPVTLHSGRAAQVIVQRRLRISFAETASYGEQDFASLTQLVTVNGRLQPLPVASRIPFQSVGLNFDASYQLSRTWTLSLSSFFLHSGGTTVAARTSLPLQDTGRAQLSLAWQAALAHRFEVTSGVTLFFFDQGQRYVLGDLLLGWDWQFMRSARLTLRAGASLINNQPDAVTPPSVLTLPNASALMTHRFATKRATTVELSYGLSMTPLFDRITGEVYGRPTFDLAFGVLFSPHWTFKIGGSTAFALRSERALRDVLAFGSMSLGYTTRSRVNFEFGVRGFVDVFVYTPTVAPFTQWVGYLSTTFGTRERF